MKKLNYRTILVGLISILMFGSCSTTKHLAEGEVLYIGTPTPEVINYEESKTGESTMEEVMGAINVAPNNSFFGSPKTRWPFPFGLWIYNRFERYEKGVGKWIFNKLAADPVYISTVNPDTRSEVATNLLKDYGYFNGKVTYKVDTMSNPKKAKLNYTVSFGRGYMLDSIMYIGFDKRCDSLILAKKSETYLHKDDPFNVNMLNQERERLVELFKNNGYYFYRSEFITFLADTIIRPGYVNLKVVQQVNVPKDALRTYYIGNTTVNLIGQNGEQPTDSARFGKFMVKYAGEKPGVRFGVLRRRFLYRSGEIYSQLRQNYSQEALSRLGIFKFNEFRYNQKPGTDTLDIVVNAMFDLPYDAELELNVKTKSTKQTGPGAFNTNICPASGRICQSI